MSKNLKQFLAGAGLVLICAAIAKFSADTFFSKPFADTTRIAQSDDDEGDDDEVEGEGIDCNINPNQPGCGGDDDVETDELDTSDEETTAIDEATEAAKKKATEEAAAKKRAEEEAAQKAAEEEAARKRAVEAAAEAERQQAAQKAAADAEAQRQAAAEEAARIEAARKEALSQPIIQPVSQPAPQKTETPETTKHSVAPEENTTAPAVTTLSSESSKLPIVKTLEEAQAAVLESMKAEALEQQEEKKEFFAAVKEFSEAGIKIDTTKPAAIAPVIVNVTKNKEYTNHAAKVILEESQAIALGTPPAEAGKQKKQKLQKKEAELRNAEIAKKSEAQGKQILSSDQDTDGDGFSDQLEIYIGGTLTQKKFFGQTDGAKKQGCTTGLSNGIKLSVRGGSVLAACSSKAKSKTSVLSAGSENKKYTLIAIDTKGRKTELQTEELSENGYIVFTMDQIRLPAGTYAFQVVPVQTAAFFGDSAMASVLQDRTESSDPVLVQITEEEEVPAPIVENIGNVTLGTVSYINDISDIKVKRTKDGFIKVTGKIEDVTSMVVMNVKSAVFTSAMLADVEGGRFSIVSANALDTGDHEVVIYASRPEDNVQSSSVKVNFSIVEDEKIEKTPPLTGDIARTVNTAAPETLKEKSSLPLVAGGVGVLVLAAGIVFMFKRKKT